MVLNLGSVIEDDKVTGYGSANIIIYTLIGIMGVFMGIFFGIQFFLKSNKGFLIINLIAFIVGITSLIFLYWYTGKN
jgi:hypothetical protein